METELSDFSRRLEMYLPGLSRGQRRIADFRLTSHDEAAFLTAADLARRVGVSEARFVRFAVATGYEGFPALRRQLQKLYRNQVTPAVRLHMPHLTGAGGGWVALVERKAQDLTSGESEECHARHTLGSYLADRSGAGLRLPERFPR